MCAWIPLFALRAEEHRRPDLKGKPLALLSPHDTRRVWQLSPRARHAGVRVGMTVSQAIGLCPALTLLEADPVHYDERFSCLLLALGNVSPVVETVEMGRVFIGVDGLNQLYGGPTRQLAEIERRIAQGAGISERGLGGDGSLSPSPSRREEGGEWAGLRLGWARGKFAAWVAASRAKPGSPIVLRDGEQTRFLRTQPVATLPIEPDTYRRLWQLGVRTLGDLASLPEVAIVSQFGREGRRAWQLAAGTVVEPVVGKQTPKPIRMTVDFPLPITDQQTLGRSLDTLIERALHHPRRLGWRVHVVRAQATTEHGASWLTHVTLKDPTTAPGAIAAPLKIKLERSPPKGAVNQLTVEFIGLVRGTNELQLFTRDAASAARAGRRRALRWAVREVKARLNHPLLHHVIEVHPWSRIPERRFALVDFDP